MSDWRKALVEARDRIGDDLRFVDDEEPTVAGLRQQLIRTRLAAAAERQAHEARACVLDFYCDETGKHHIVCAVPTGDRHELRELMRDAFAAMLVAQAEMAAEKSAEKPDGEP